MDVALPPSFAKHFRGPKFGVAGTQWLTGVGAPASDPARTVGVQASACSPSAPPNKLKLELQHGLQHGLQRPLIGTIIKPSIGLTPQQTAALVKTLAEAGIDFIKDDELMANPPHSPFDERVDAIMRVLNTHADRTGKRVMYAFNISDELDAMERELKPALLALKKLGARHVHCKVCFTFDSSPTIGSIAFEVGLQNGGMASGLAAAMGKLGTVGLAAACFIPWMNISGSVLANYWSKRPAK